jgi:hypothetical protein
MGKQIKKRIQPNCRSVISSNFTLRQTAGNYADYGFWTSQNSNQYESITGHAMPVIKPNSTEPKILDVFAALASFASNTRPLSRPDKNHFASIDDDICHSLLTKLMNKIKFHLWTKQSNPSNNLTDAIMMHHLIWKIILMLSVSQSLKERSKYHATLSAKKADWRLQASLFWFWWATIGYWTSLREDGLMPTFFSVALLEATRSHSPGGGAAIFHPLLENIVFVTTLLFGSMCFPTLLHDVPSTAPIHGLWHIRQNALGELSLLLMIPIDHYKSCPAESTGFK